MSWDSRASSGRAPPRRGTRLRPGVSRGFLSPERSHLPGCSWRTWVAGLWEEEEAWERAGVVKEAGAGRLSHTRRFLPSPSLGSARQPCLPRGHAFSPVGPSGLVLPCRASTVGPGCAARPSLPPAGSAVRERPGGSDRLAAVREQLCSPGARSRPRDFSVGIAELIPCPLSFLKRRVLPACESSRSHSFNRPPFML